VRAVPPSLIGGWEKGSSEGSFTWNNGNQEEDNQMDEKKEREMLEGEISSDPFKTLVDLGEKLRSEYKDIEVYDLCWVSIPKGHGDVDIVIIIRMWRKER